MPTRIVPGGRTPRTAGRARHVDGVKSARTRTDRTSKPTQRPAAPRDPTRRTSAKFSRRRYLSTPRLARTAPTRRRHASCTCGLQCQKRSRALAFLIMDGNNCFRDSFKTKERNRRGKTLLETYCWLRGCSANPQRAKSMGVEADGRPNASSHV